MRLNAEYTVMDLLDAVPVGLSETERALIYSAINPPSYRGAVAEWNAAKHIVVTGPTAMRPLGCTLSEIVSWYGPGRNGRNPSDIDILAGLDAAARNFAPTTQKENNA